MLKYLNESRNVSFLFSRMFRFKLKKSNEIEVNQSNDYYLVLKLNNLLNQRQDYECELFTKLLYENVSEIKEFDDDFVKKSDVIKVIYNLLDNSSDVSSCIFLLKSLSLIFKKSELSQQQFFVIDKECLLLRFCKCNVLKVMVNALDVIVQICNTLNGSLYALNSQVFDFALDSALELLRFIEDDNFCDSQLMILNKILDIIQLIVYFQEKINQFIPKIFTLIDIIFESKARNLFLQYSMQILFYLTTNHFEKEVMESKQFQKTIDLLNFKENSKYFVTILQMLSQIIVSTDEISAQYLESFQISFYINLFIQEYKNSEICFSVLQLLSNVVISSSEFVNSFLENETFFDILHYILLNSDFKVHKAGLLLLWNMLYIGLRSQKEEILKHNFYDELCDSFQMDDDSFLINALNGSLKIIISAANNSNNIQSNFFRIFVERIAPLIGNLTSCRNITILKLSRNFMKYYSKIQN